MIYSLKTATFNLMSIGECKGIKINQYEEKLYKNVYALFMNLKISLQVSISSKVLTNIQPFLKL